MDIIITELDEDDELEERESVSHSLTQLSFRKQLAVQLCKVSSQPVTPANIGRPSLPETPERLLGEHFPDKLSKKARCVVCMERMTTRVHDSHYGCPNCAMHLCVETREHSTKSCFAIFHSIKYFRTAKKRTKFAHSKY